MMQPNGPPFYLQQPHQQQQFVDQQRQGDKENGGEQLTEEQSVLLPPLAPPPTADLNLFQFPTNQQQQHHHRDGENRQPPRHVHQQSMHLPPPQLPHVMHHRQLHAATQQPIPQHHPLQPVVVPQQPSAAVAATVPPPLVQVQPIRPSPPPPLSLINSANKYTKVRAHQTFALKCRFRPDGLAVATTSADQSAKLWSCNTHKLVNTASVVLTETTRCLDTVFKCCLPHFPLRSRAQSEQVLMSYCEGASIFDDDLSAPSAGTANANSSSKNGLRHQSAASSSGAVDVRPARALPIVQPEYVESVGGSAVNSQQLLQPQQQQQHSSASSSSSSPTNSSNKLSFRERAQSLQIYLDKFLEYTTRETIKIDWADPSRRMECANFMLDRVIVSYIYEVFPDAEANGVDVFGGWEGTLAGEEEEDGSEQDGIVPPMLDTVDPIIIARYWLIRWIINIASESKFNANANGRAAPPPGLALFKQALFSSQRATNVLLTLMREAFRLPLACCIVIQKVLDLLRHWLLQRDHWSVLLIHMLFSFFRSPYLSSPGDRLQTAITITHSILQIVRDLANPSSTILARPLSKAVWQELIKELGAAVELTTAKPDAFGQATAGGLTRTLLSVYIFVTVIREAKLDEQRMWDDALTVFRTCIWSQMVEQWAHVVDSMTRALVLNLFAIDINQLHEAVTSFSGDESAAAFCVLPSHNTTLSETASSNGSSTFCRGYQPLAGNVPAKAVGAALVPCCNIIKMLARHSPFGRRRGREDGGQHATGTNGGSISGEAVHGVIQSTGNAVVWLRAWMRVLCLVDTGGDVRHAQLSVQTVGRSIDTLVQVGCANQLVHWLCTLLLRRLQIVAEQPHAIPVLFTVLITSDPPDLQRAYILRQLLNCLAQDELAPLVLDHIPALRNLEDMAVISTDTIATLQKLVRNQEFSSRAIRVASLLSLNHPDAEKILLQLLEQRQFQIDTHSLVLCLNALALLVLERADAPLFERLFALMLGQQSTTTATLLPIFCANLASSVTLGFHSQLVHALVQSLARVKHLRIANELKWQLCAVFARHSISLHWSNLADKFVAASDDFFEGFVLRLSGQWPLPGFPVSQWNSLPAATTPSTTMAHDQHQQQQQANADGGAAAADHVTFMETDGAILSLDKDIGHLWSRTHVGRHCYRMQTICAEEESESPVEEWLNTLACLSDTAFQSTTATSVRQKSSSLGAAIDPFQDLPRPSMRSVSFSAVNNNNSGGGASDQQQLPLFDITGPEMLQYIQSSSRCPDQLFGIADGEQLLGKLEKKCHKNVPMRSDDFALYNDGTLADAVDNADGWCRFVSSFGLLAKVRHAPSNFHREIRHLDLAQCREVHKVAVIYVAKDQQDKLSILSNSCGSNAFNSFVDGLGWTVHIGSPHFHGYTGGLPHGQLVPYFCSANTELIFHVSTLLNGDNTQRLKHLGNDEVHVVWSENNSKPYRRDLIATRFCDVLIVLYLASPVLLRVHIEVQDPRLQFGPLFDGACIHVLQAASLVRETVLNASRAYRNLRVECDRPNKHREKVFREKKQMLTHHPLASALVRLLLHPKMGSSNGSTRRRGGGQEGRRGIIDENQGIA
uniref:Rap-GAP domain-containing protein n=1 Tax=Globodera pallida TaxID=36090 RepID=A0A183BHY0_GLOPA